MEGTFFYIVGITLAVLAVAVSFLGLARERFPVGRRVVVGVTGLFAAVVVLTAVGAVMTAREEMRERNEELAHLEQEQAQEAEEEDPASGSPAPGGDADLEQGRQTFNDEGCGGCHILADAGGSGTAGPNLDETTPGQDEDHIRQQIVDPSAEVTPGYQDGIMPQDYGERLSEEEIDALVAYLGAVTAQ